MPILNIRAVVEALSEPRIREKIICDYSLSKPPQDALAFADAVIESLGQCVIPDAAHRHVGNGDVFQAAVRSIASSSRRWSTFLEVEPRLCELLHGYDPVAVRDCVTDDDLKEIGRIVGGYGDLGTNSIQVWADRLADSVPYCENLTALADVLQTLNRRSIGRPLTGAEVMLCTVSYLSAPAPARWDGEPLLRRADSWPREVRKLPGMGFPLGSEFLRNLGWNGFKPDRHIQRLLRAWVPDLIASCEQESIRLGSLAGRRNKSVRENLQLCLAGNALSSDENHLRTDNLIWLLGAYVETTRNQRPRPPGYYIIPD